VVFSPRSPVYRPEHVIFDAEQVYFGPLLGGLEKGARRHGVELVYTQAVPEELLDFVAAEKIDALLLMLFHLYDVAVLEALQEKGIPYVAIGVSPPPGGEHLLACIDASNHEGGRLAARHLIDLGHRKLGCVNLAGSFVNHCDRMQGYLDEIKGAGIEIDFDHVLIHVEYNVKLFADRIDTWIEHLVATDNLPTALFVCDFTMTSATINALQLWNIDIPGRISIVGFDDPPSAAQLNPPLTAVKQPVEALALRAVERLVAAHAEASGKMVAGTEWLPVELTARQSSAPIAIQ
jgi:DNA-binding LacI/PurR family transcriptional regulator